ncbi:MAG: hypothetical protein U5J99_09340 [Parvularculaceae bacterium]|nr:hypothetical protein [Parvularculaceae bacterium]
MTQSSPDPNAVHELQAMAAEAALPIAQARKTRSRAASLHLIDLLSRWGGSGLAVFAAAAIFITTVVARDQPLRAGVWAAMVFAALYLCRRYRREFRRGDKIAARPFRWRAYYTATIAVVSAAFGAGAFLLAIPAQGAARVEIIALLIAGTLTAAGLHTAYRSTALAAALPASMFVAVATLRMSGISLVTVAILAILVAGSVALWIASGQIGAAADRRFPRTRLIRREIERSATPEPVVATVLANAAAKA